LRRISSDRFHFEWIDGTSLFPGWSNWYESEPTGGDESCVTMGWRYSIGRGLQWTDIPCTNWESRFICQRKAPGIVTAKIQAEQVSVMSRENRLFEFLKLKGYYILIFDQLILN